MARMIVGSREYVMSRYKLTKLKEIEDMVADAVQIVSEFWMALIGSCGCYQVGFGSNWFQAQLRSLSGDLLGVNANVMVERPLQQPHYWYVFGILFFVWLIT